MEELYQGKSSTWNKPFLFSITGVLVLILGWVIISTLANNDLIFPKIDQIASAIFDIFRKGENLKYIAYDVIRIIFSIVISFVIAILTVFVYIKFKNYDSGIKWVRDNAFDHRIFLNDVTNHENFSLYLEQKGKDWAKWAIDTALTEGTFNIDEYYSLSGKLFALEDI